MNSAINQSMGFYEWVMLITLSILWGGSFFFIEVVVTELPPLTIVLSRVGLAAVALWIFAASTGLRPPTNAGIWLAFLVMGMINNVIPFSLLVWGQTHMASSLASILNATTPLFTVVVAGVFLTDERLTVAKLTGVAFGLAGVILMIGPEALGGFSHNVLAQLAVLGTAVSYAFASVYGRRFETMGLHPVILAAGQVTASSLILLPVVFYFDQPQHLALPTVSAIAAILALGIFSTALAYVLYFRILATAGATNLMLVTFLVPVSAILLGSLVLGEVLQPVHLAGMALISGGLIAIDGRLLKLCKPTKTGAPE
ncbi:MAG: DMT family transporter [Gammaproteobacteria bacterium]|nr:DMT family transporter [Gammaproteobacteria bacterium]